jgi:hypothetical protein
MKTKISTLLILTVSVITYSCKKNDAAPAIVASTGTTQTINGGTGGASAVNSVFLDLSTDGQDSVARSSWDLGLYCGSDFKAIINNTTWAKAVVLNKTDLSTVGAADTMSISFAQTYSTADYAFIDTVKGDMSKTVIPAVSASDGNNSVVILNRGTGGSIAARPWVKLRILRNGTSGYTIQYAGITETTYHTITITKDDAYNFKYLSFDNGTVTVEPQKKLWDIEWTYSIYQTPYGTGDIPYAFSDLILTNILGGTTAAEILTSRVSYDNYSDTSITNTTFSSDKFTIGSNWRSTQPATGVKTDRFYVIKDVAGNVYKIKFLSMGVNDGGTRGYPQLAYKLVKKGN